MSNITGTIRGSLKAATTPTVYNVSAALAATEYSQVLSPATKAFTIKVRDGGARLQLAFVSGQSGTNYITVPRGAVLGSEDLSFTGTLYFQVSQAAQVVEILEWQ